MPTTTKLSSNQIRRRPSLIKEALSRGHIIFTTYGRETHAIVSFEEYCRISGEFPEAVAAQVAQASVPRRSPPP